MLRSHHRFSLLLFLFFVSTPQLLASDQAKRTNVVFILTDNHGAWTLGCYGNDEIRTPNIDKLAKEGTLMTRAFSSNPVCSPTRATFLTGLMPSQHGVHCFLRGGRLQTGPDARNTLEEFQSIPEILKEQGYRCGLVGKWHLGGNMQPQEGLDDYWITMPHGGTSTFYDAAIIEDGKQRKEPKYLTDFWTDHAVEFIKQKDERPFFLYLAYNGPYALSRLLLQEGKNRHADYYRNKELKTFPHVDPHPWQYNNLDYFNNPVSNRRVATEVSGVDDGVGRIMETLKEQGLDENTVVVFAADQGWAGGHGGFYGMGDHTRPVTATDEMMQIPMIWRHPKKIQAGQRSDLIVTNYDFLPTLINYLGYGDQIKNEPPLPGRDFSAVLTGKSMKDWVAEAFYEFEFLRTLRTDQWKLTRRYPNGPDELFDLKNDPEEQNNIYGMADAADEQNKLQNRLDEFYSKSVLPKYDLLNGGGSQTVLFHPPLPKQNISAEEAAQRDEFDKSHLIRVPEGYTVEKVASSDLAQHPMMGGFDNQGRLYVAESAGLNMRNNELEQELPNSIKMLEDTNGDGIFDKSTVFADKMTFPMGACWHRGSLYVASPPFIWRLEDTDGDGVADVREKLPAQFGFSGNAASVHGCFLSPEGRLYWCDGRHGHEIKDRQGNVKAKKSGSYIFSAWPDGSDLQVHAGGGMDNPVEVDFTDTGDVLGTVNILYTGPRIDCLVHWLHGGVYPHSERVLGEFTRTGDLLGPVHQFGHVGVSGTTRYRSGVLERDFVNDMFVTIFNTGQLVRVELDKKGSTYTSKQHEFLTCSDPDFHPTDVIEDADGSLLLIDTGGWFRIGCPTSQIAKPDIKGGIYRIRKKGMPSWVDPRGLQVKWDKLTNRELIFKLMDTRFAVRERAIEECAQRGDAILPDMKTWIQRGDIPIRKHGLWACTRMRSPEAQEVVRIALNDPDQTVRAIASKSAGVNRDKLAVNSLIERLNDESAAVRRAALTALGKIGAPEAVTPLLNHAPKITDRPEDHALIYALIEIASPELTAKGLTSKQSETRRVALTALHQIASDQLKAEQVMSVIAAGGPGTMKASLSVLEEHPEWADSVANLISKWVSNEVEIEKSGIISLLQKFAVSQSLQVEIQKGLNTLPANPEKFTALIQGIASSSLKEIPSSWKTDWLSAIQSQNATVSQVSLRGLKGKRHPFNEPLQNIVNDSSANSENRILALEALPPGKLSDSSFEFLTETIELGSPPNHVERAISVLGASQLNANQLEEIASLVPTAGPLELQGMFKIISKVSDKELLKEFASALAIGRSRKTLATQQLLQLSRKWPTGAKSALKPLLDELQSMEAAQVEKLTRLEPLTKHGSTAKGRDVFFSEKAKCATCHRIGDQGGKIGPDLSAIGRIRRERDLLEAILFPSKTFAREYEPYSIVTEDGKVVSGLISHETAETLSIQQATGEPVVIQRSKIETMAPAAVSVMPQGLETGLSEQQLADLVAFLKSLTTPPQN